MALPKTTQDRINTDAENYVHQAHCYIGGDEHSAYIAGATAENEWAQMLADTLRGCIGTIIFWYEVLSQTEGFGLVESEYLEAKNQSIKRIETALQQWNAGKETKYEGSVITEPIPGIALGCISPEARDLLDTIMEQWEKHYISMKEMHGDAMPETTFYGFAYWLVRWSGLIQPLAKNPDRPCPHCGNAFRELENIHKKYHDLNGDNPAANHMLKIARKYLHQWNAGKEVKHG